MSKHAYHRRQTSPQDRDVRVIRRWLRRLGFSPAEIVRCQLDEARPPRFWRRKESARAATAAEKT